MKRGCYLIQSHVEMFDNWNLFAICFFFVHIPVTLFLDLQALLPADMFPLFARNMLKWYSTATNDPFMNVSATKQNVKFAWFRGLILCLSDIRCAYRHHFGSYHCLFVGD